MDGPARRVVSYDFNGDGLADFGQRIPNSPGWRICLSTGDGEFAGQDSSGKLRRRTAGEDCPTWGGPTFETFKSFAGDFNGDGRTDLAGYVRAGATAGVGVWNVCLSTGSGFNCAERLGPPQPADGSSCGVDCFEGFSADFDGNGKSDIVVNAKWANGVQGEGYLYYGLAQGTMPDLMTTVATGLQAQTRIEYAPLTKAGVLYQKIRANDENFPAPGQDEISIQSPMYVVEATRATAGQASTRWFETRYGYSQLIANKWGRGLYGFRGRTIIENILVDANGGNADDSQAHATGIVSSHTWPHIGRAALVVKQARKPNSAQFATVSTSRMEYAARCRSTVTSQYVSCPSAVPAVGFIWESLQTVSVQNPRHKRDATGAFIALLPLERATDLDGSSLLPTTYVFTGVSPTGNASNSDPQIPTTAPSLATLNQFVDSFGNPRRVETHVQHPTTDERWLQTAENSYYDNGGDTARWLLGKLSSATTTSNVSGGNTQSGTITRKSQFTYHGIATASCTGAVAGQLCTETIEPDFETGGDRSLFQRSSYQYDAFGNRTRSTVNFFDDAAGSGGLRTRESTMEYSLGRYPASTKRIFRSEGGNADSSRDLADVTAYGDARCRMPTKVTDANLNYATMSYDGFCRKVAEAAYTSDNKLVKWSTFSLDTVAEPTTNGRDATKESYRLVTTSSDGAQSIAYYDNLQRAVRSKAKTFGNGFTEAKTTFDALGRQRSVTKRVATTTAGNPTVVSSDETTTQYEYDALNRVTLETLPDATTVSTTYNGLSTTVHSHEPEWRRYALIDEDGEREGHG